MFFFEFVRACLFFLLVVEGSLTLQIIFVSALFGRAYDHVHSLLSCFFSIEVVRDSFLTLAAFFSVACARMRTICPKKYSWSAMIFIGISCCVLSSALLSE
ncbi:unnamed protein product [Ectocarpus sp. 13 AM-2016]